MISKRISFTTMISMLFILISTGPSDANSYIHPEFSKKALSPGLKSLVISDILMYEMSSGTNEPRSDWAKTAQNHIEKAVSEELKKRGIELNMNPIPQEAEAEWGDVKALYNELNNQMNTLARFPNNFPEGQQKMTYQVGSIENIIKGSGSNYLLYINGVDCIPTAGRTASKAALTTLAVVVGALTGVIAPVQWGEITYLDIAMLDSAGIILWRKSFLSRAGHDLRNYESVHQIVLEILKDFNPGMSKDNPPITQQTKVN